MSTPTSTTPSSSPGLFKIHSTCRVCKTTLGKPYLDLGEQPLANALVIGPVTEQRYPLAVTLCETCGLSQLTVVVDPEILYSGYRFRSGASPVWVQHCEELAKRCTKEFGDRFPPGRVLDIAANDGTQLEFFARRGWECYGIDPEPEYHGDCDLVIARGFWPDSFIERPLNRGLFDLVIAQNVLGHVDDPVGFLKAIKTVLAPKGRVVVEVPHVYPLLRNCAFDTVYHEHLSYWSQEPLDHAAELAGLVIEHWEDLAVHGGSVRFWLKHASPNRRVVGPTAFHVEDGVLPYTDFAQRVGENLRGARLIVSEQWRIHGAKIVGWGASAKATVYLNALEWLAEGDVEAVTAIIDETPEKQGLLVPGVHIPIIPPPDDLSDVDVIWILSWNNEQPIKEKARARGFRGKFLLTNGTPRLEA